MLDYFYCYAVSIFYGLGIAWQNAKSQRQRTKWAENKKSRLALLSIRDKGEVGLEMISRVLLCWKKGSSINRNRQVRKMSWFGGRGGGMSSGLG